MNERAWFHLWPGWQWLLFPWLREDTFSCRASGNSKLNSGCSLYSLSQRTLLSNFNERIYRSLLKWLLSTLEFPFPWKEEKKDFSFLTVLGGSSNPKIARKKKHSLSLKVVLLCGRHLLNQNPCNFNAAWSRDLSTRKCFFMLILNSGFILLKWNGEE